MAFCKNEMDVQNGTVPGPTIAVACTQKLEWSSFWGPEITCTPDLPSSHTTLTVGNTVDGTGSDAGNPSTTTSTINNVIGYLLSSLSSETETFKCNLFSKNASIYEATFQCLRTTTDNTNLKHFLNNTLDTLSDCVYNTTIVIRSVLNPVSEIDLVLPKLISITSNYTATVADINRNSYYDDDDDGGRGVVGGILPSDVTSHGVGNRTIGVDVDDSLLYGKPFIRQCTSNVYQVLNCSNLAINQSFYENEQPFLDSLVNSSTTVTLFDQSIKCFLSVNNWLSATALAVADDIRQHQQHIFNNSSFSGVNGTSLYDGHYADDGRFSHDGNYYRQNRYTTNHPRDGGGADVLDNIVGSVVAGSYDWSFLFVIIFIFAGGLGNILVCLAVALDRKLQNVTNYFLFSLAIADLLVSLFVMPLGAIPSFLGKCIVCYILHITYIFINI